MTTTNEYYPVEKMDARQAEAYTHFSDDVWLGTQNGYARCMDWVTFYKRNEELFVEHYLGLKLFEFQAIALHELGVHDSSTIVASRASSKTYIVAIHACAKCILCPGFLVVVAAATKEQARILVYEKIKGELLRDSNVLGTEIKSITTGKNDTKVDFENGSSITVVVGNENARGHRANLLILDEFRMMSQNIYGTVLDPMIASYMPHYLHLEEYRNLHEHVGTVFISSSWYCNHWMWGKMQSALQSYLNDGPECMFCFDYAISLKHGIKPLESVMSAYKNLDPVSWQIEYCNYMVRENTHAYFTFDMLNSCRTLKHQFYPRKTLDYISKTKNKYSIPKKEGEIRIVTCDIAMVNRAGNDNSSFTCMRLLPEGVSGEDDVAMRVYRRQVPYAEAMPGCETSKQAIRIKQLFEDFNADFCVLDVRNAGISVYDALAKILYDEERNCEYEPWSCINDDVIAARVPIAGAKKVVYAISANAKLNNDIAISLRNIFINKQIDLLESFDESIDSLKLRIPEYFETIDPDVQVFYERPYYETTALINEMVGLEYEVSPNTKLITIREVGKATKDRYSSLAYGNIFAEYLERDLLSNSKEYEYCTLVN